jgi:hypothetical protein
MEIHKKNPHKEDTPTANTSPRAKESTDSHPETTYAISQEGVNAFRIITIAYTRQIGALP